jgi:hypothetical protein
MPLESLAFLFIFGFALLVLLCCGCISNVSLTAQVFLTLSTEKLAPESLTAQILLIFQEQVKNWVEIVNFYLHLGL